MNQTSSQPSPRSIGRTVIAALILLIAAYVLLKIVIGIVMAIALPIVAVLALIALVWAYRVLF